MTLSYRLSPMQQSMLSSSLFDQRSGTYIQQLVLRTKEELDEGAFRTAWSELVRRHAILRTAFCWQGLAEPMQSVIPDATMPWVDLDWREVEADTLESRFESCLDEDRARGFALETAPLHRLTVIRVRDRERWIVWTYHHALLDGRARLMMIEELFRLYEAKRAGEELQLEPEVAYRGYIDWLHSRNLAASEVYWRQLLAGFTEPNQISSARSTPIRMPAGQSRGQLQQWVSPSLDADLRVLAERQGVTLNTLIQAAWGILVAKHSGLDDVVFGATRSCRKSVPDGDAMVGPIINTTPVRLKVEPDKPVADFIRELRAQHLSVRDHEHTPAAWIHQWSDIPAGSPLFTTLVVFENYYLVKAKGGDWEKRQFELKEQTDHLVLAGYLAERLLLKIEYDRRLFDDEVVGRMLSQVIRILDSMVTCQDGRLRDLQVLPEHELQQVLVEWNDTAAEYPAQATLGELFSARAARTPHAIAVVSRSESLSYAELETRSNQLARALRSKGVGPDGVVALLLDRCCELATALLGVLKAGGGYLPLDPAYPEDRLAYMIDDSRAKMVLTRGHLAEGLKASGVDLLRLDADWERVVEGEDGSPLQPIATPADLAYLMYTAGSTGQPKGVMIPHRGVVNLCEAIRQCYGLTAADRVLQYASISFDICVEEIYPTWHAGGAVVFRDDSEGRSIHDFIDWAGREGITVFDLPTAFWNELVHGLTAVGAGLPGSLRLTVVGGEKASRATLDAWCGIPGAERVTWLNTYGPTETTVTVSVYQLMHGSEAGEGDPPIGKPIANTRFYVLDQHFAPTPIGVPGELFIGGAGVARGYLGRPELTARAFLRDPFATDPDARMYRTGDIVRYASDGALSFVGRNDNQVKVSGFRIELEEIEATIERHAGVRRAVVRAIDSPNATYLAAYVVPAGNGPANPGMLTEFLHGALPEYMVPQAFVMMERLPMTPGGKVDRKALPAPDLPSPTDSGEDSAQDEVERNLLTAFEELFPGRRIGIRDNFFELGGYSLLAFRLLTKIERECGKRLSFAALTRAGTVEGLAHLIRASEQLGSAHSHIVPLQTEGDGPALFLIHGVGGSVHWYHALAGLLRPHFPVYGIQSPGMEEGDDDMIGADVENLAQLYRDEIKSIQPRGPYHVGGHSMGGIIAFEMARQFHAQGDAVALVVNFDNWNRAVDAPDFGTKLYRLGRHFLRLGTREKLRFLGDKIRWARQEWSSRKALGKDHPETGRLGEMKAANTQAARKYIPGFYPGKLTIFRACEQNATALNDPLLGWGGMASEIDVVEVPGNHYTLLSDPNVHVLAEELKRLLAAGTGAGSL